MSSSPNIIENPWLGFLIWQSITSTSIYLLLPLPPSTLLPSPLSLLSFLTYHLSLLLLSLSLSLFLLSCPHPDPSASLPHLFAFVLKSSLKSLLGGYSNPSVSPDLRRRVRMSLVSVIFLVICGVSGFLAVVAVCGKEEMSDGLRVIGLGLWGSVFGLVYGIHYLYRGGGS